MNKDLIKNLKILQTYYRSQGDRGRAVAYSRAISTLKMLKFNVDDVSQVEGKRYIGPNIKSKIKEFLDTGQIDAAQNKKTLIYKGIKQGEKNHILKKLQTVWGIGPQRAQKLYKEGVHSIDDLIKYNDLTKKEKIGLKYRHDLIKRIPRKIISVVHTLLKYFLNTTYGKDSYILEIAGSYRRGAPDSGDIDVLVSSKVFTLKEMVTKLENIGLITDIESMKKEKFMGIFKCPKGGPYMRMDILFVQEEDWIPALLYFTGSKDTNIFLRGKAKRMGMTLNQHGLYRNGIKMDTNTEKDIFKLLELEYISPKDR